LGGAAQVPARPAALLRALDRPGDARPLPADPHLAQARASRPPLLLHQRLEPGDLPGPRRQPRGPRGLLIPSGRAMRAPAGSPSAPGPALPHLKSAPNRLPPALGTG